jgi:hypothetical protein
MLILDVVEERISTLTGYTEMTFDPH